MDYKDVHFIDGENGIGTAGSLKLIDSPIDYVPYCQEARICKM